MENEESKADLARSARARARFKANYRYWKPSKSIKAPYQTMDFTCKKCGYVINNEFVKAFFDKVKPCPSCKKKLNMEKQAKQKALKATLKAAKSANMVNKDSLEVLLRQLNSLDMRNVKWS